MASFAGIAPNTAWVICRNGFPEKSSGSWQKKIYCRIHFALNCGAKSCPPIAFYKYDKIDEQLDVATRSFLKSETEFDDQNKTVYVTKIMHWFKADFGGTEGIRNLLHITFGHSFNDYNIKFKDYD